jgi:hypothetical protein
MYLLTLLKDEEVPFTVFTSSFRVRSTARQAVHLHISAYALEIRVVQRPKWIV